MPTAMTPELRDVLRDSLKLYDLGSKAERLSDTAYALPASMAELDQIQAEKEDIEERIKRVLRDRRDTTSDASPGSSRGPE